MSTILKSVLGFGSSLFSGVWGYVIVGSVAAVVAAGSTGTLVYRYTTAAAAAKYEALQLKDANAATAIAEQTTAAVSAVKDIEIKEAQLATEQATEEAAAQADLKQKVKVIHDEVPVFITPAVNAHTCLPNILVSLLNRAITAANSGEGDSATAEPAAVEPDDACSPITVSDFANGLIDGVIRPAAQNAEQLNSLEQSITKLLNEANARSSPATDAADMRDSGS